METDLILMSLCVFVPSLFALGLIFFPKGSEEGMRWWSLVGTAVTFVLSTFVFINYLSMLAQRRDPDQAKRDNEIVRPNATTSLSARSRAADDQRFENKPALSDDQLARYPW